MKSKKEIAEMKDDAVDKKVEDLKKELMKFRSQVASGTIPKNPGKIKLIRKTLAQIYTMKTRREKQRNE